MVEKVYHIRAMINYWDVHRDEMNRREDRNILRKKNRKILENRIVMIVESKKLTNINCYQLKINNIAFGAEIFVLR